MKDCLFYIPGFGSNSKGDKADAFRTLCASMDWNFVALDYPDSYDPEVVEDAFVSKVKATTHGNALFFGTSLGGFWASYLANKFNGRSLLVNPSMIPGETLQRYLTKSGKATSFDGSVKSLTLEMAIAYFAYQSDTPRKTGNVVILCKDDEILNHEIARLLFKDSSDLIVLDTGGHRATGQLNIIIDAAARMMNREYT